MKKWVFISIILLLVIIGKALASGMFGLMQPPSFHFLAPDPDSTRVSRGDDTRVSRALDTRIIR